MVGWWCLKWTKRGGRKQEFAGVRVELRISLKLLRRCGEDSGEKIQVRLSRLIAQARYANDRKFCVTSHLPVWEIYVGEKRPTTAKTALLVPGLWLRYNPETPRLGETERNLIQNSLCVLRCQAAYFPEMQPYRIFLIVLPPIYYTYVPLYKFKKFHYWHC